MAAEALKQKGGCDRSNYTLQAIDQKMGYEAPEGSGEGI
jgi:hypothetical protein